MNIAYATAFPLQLALGSQWQDERNGLTENLTAGSASVYLAVATVCAGVSFIWMARVDTFAEKAAQTEFYNSCALAWYFGVGLLLSVGLYVNSTELIYFEGNSWADFGCWVLSCGDRSTVIPCHQLHLREGRLYVGT